MLAAQDVGLTTAGYVFITYDLLLDSCISETASAEENDRACQAYEGLLDISLFVPRTDAYENFTAEVRRRMADPPFNRSMKPEEEVCTLHQFPFTNGKLHLLIFSFYSILILFIQGNSSMQKPVIQLAL